MNVERNLEEAALDKSLSVKDENGCNEPENYSYECDFDEGEIDYDEFDTLKEEFTNLRMNLNFSKSI